MVFLRLLVLEEVVDRAGSFPVSQMDLPICILVQIGLVSLLRIRSFLVLLVPLGGAAPGGAGEANYFGLLDDLVVYAEVLSQG